MARAREARRKRRAALFKEQDGGCHYCSGRMRIVNLQVGVAQPPDMATLEHVQQKAEGGTYGDENTKLACAACNVMRPNGMDSETYLDLRRSLLDIWPPCTPAEGPTRRAIQRQGPQTLYQIAHGASA